MNGTLDLAAYASDCYIIVCIALCAESVVGRISWLFRILPHPSNVPARFLFGFGRQNSAEGRRLPWFGHGTPRLSELDAHRALMLSGYSCVVNVALVLGLAMANFSLSG